MSTKHSIKLDDIAHISIKIVDLPHEVKGINRFKSNLRKNDKSFYSPDPFEENAMSALVSAEKTTIFAENDDGIIFTVDTDIGKSIFINTFLIHSIPIERFNSYSKKALSITKYYFDPGSFEDETVVAQLFTQFYYFQRSKGIKFDFILAKKEQAKFFEKLGYITFPNCKEMYEILPMIIITEYEGLLRNTNSPYYKMSLKFKNSNNTSAWFDYNFKRKIDYEKSQLSKTEQLYKLAKYLSEAFLDHHFIFNHLSIYEIEHVLNFANVLRFFEGEHIINEGELGNDLYIILMGSAIVQKTFAKDDPVVLATLETGEIFGEMSFLNEQPRNADIVAAENMQALRFTQSILKKLLTNMPEVAAKLLLNLSLILCDRIANVNQKLMISQKMKRPVPDSKDSFDQEEEPPKRKNLQS